jgi:hypothetical protein
VVLEDSSNCGSDLDRSRWVAEQIPDHSDISGRRQFHQNNHVGSLFLESRVDGMPDTLVAEDPPFTRHFFEAHRL